MTASKKKKKKSAKDKAIKKPKKKASAKAKKEAPKKKAVKRKSSKILKSEFKFDTTKEIEVPKNILEQVIGQETAVKVMKKAAEQRRHVLLIGEPGTGKSMLGLALAEMLPKEKLVDVVSFPNPNDENQPLIRTTPAGEGRKIVANAKIQSTSSFTNQTILLIVLALIATLIPYYFWKTGAFSDVIYAASLITGMIFIVGVIFMLSFGKRLSPKQSSPKVIVDNFGKKQAPFLDATGAHAGALLGDVLHDPFQCFFPSMEMVEINNNFNRNISIKYSLDNLFNKKREIIRKKENEYESFFLDKNELFVLGENNNSISPVEVLSCNRHHYKGKMIKLTTSEKKELIVTPEHKIAVWKDGKISFIEAKNLGENDGLVIKSDEIIIDEQDIINTYGKRQQEQCKLYNQYLEIKRKNPSWGYKKIAKAMNQPEGKTRWWHAGKHIPVPIQNIQWSKRQNLLPLRSDDPRLPIISKILGALFGDGGIFQNLNGLFLSSSELESVKEFGEDISAIFGPGPSTNFRVTEGGEKGHSWCYQNTNRNLIRFFLALGAPKGNKNEIILHIPDWIYLSDKLADEFFGSFFGSETGVPKVHKQKNRLQTLDIGITGREEFEADRLDFLNRVKRYLDYKGIKTTSLSRRKTSNDNLSLYRLMISIKFDNVVRFARQIKINYCRYKKEKLINAINEFRDIKKKKYGKLLSGGYGAEHAMKVLNLTPQSLYAILNNEEIKA